VAIEYILMLAVGSSALAMLNWDSAVPYGLGFWAMTYVLLAYKADKFCKTKK
jgi:hypothetical protein